MCSASMASSGCVLRNSAADLSESIHVGCEPRAQATVLSEVFALPYQFSRVCQLAIVAFEVTQLPL